jgi:HK97 family phage prohead protease
MERRSIEVERRAIEIEPTLVTVRDGDNETTTIAGIASVAYDGTERTEFVLRQADAKRGVRKVVERIMPGAFDAVLSNKHDVRVLRNHDADNLLGRTASGTAKVFVDESSNLAYSTPAPDTQLGRDTVEMLKRGDLSGSSFAFTIGDEDFKDEGEVLSVEIKRVENLYDVGPVTYPAYAGTSAGVRSGDPDSVLRRFEEWESKHGKEEEKDLTLRHSTIAARAKSAGL